jgi:D-alanine-D-alanine ligase
MDKLTVALLSGGRSAEREVSLKSGEQVYQALEKGKYHIRRYDPRDDLARLMAEAEEIDVALIILRCCFDHPPRPIRRRRHYPRTT